MRLLVLALLPLPALAEPVPRDGTWTVATEPAGIAPACAEALRPGLEAMLARQARVEIVEVDWPGAFDPALLTPDSTTPTRWSRLTDTSWRGEVVPMGDALPFAVILWDVVSPERLEGETVILPYNVAVAGGRGADGLRPDCTLGLAMVATHDDGG